MTSNNSAPLAEPFGPQTLEEAEQALAECEATMAQSDKKIRTLRAAENIKEGIFFASEIYAETQIKNQQAVMQNFFQARVSRLKMESEL